MDMVADLYRLFTRDGKMILFLLRQELKESQSPFVRQFVRPVQVCLKQSIFIFLGQWAIREHLEH